MNLTPILPESLPVNIEGLKPFLSLTETHRRPNPDTGLPFRYGDTRAGGYRFLGYGLRVTKKTGFLVEQWCNPVAFDKIAARQAKYYEANAEKIAARKAKYRKANAEKIAAQNAKYYEANAEKIAAKRAEYRGANAEKLAAQDAKYYEANAEKLAARQAKYRKANAEKIAARHVKYRKNNPGKVNATGARRRAAKLLRTPLWLSKEQRAEIEAIYVLCAERTKITGVPHAVDHVIPLMGRTVLGLHVPWNLRIITASENCSKGNRLVQE